MNREDFDRWEAERKQRQAEREARRAERRKEREQEGKPAEDRMERVLHTRVSEDLDEAIRRAADELRVPVSNLVRNVLEDVFDAVEKVTDNVGDFLGDRGRRRAGRRGERWARRLQRHGLRVYGDLADEEPEAAGQPHAETPTARREFPDVVGWQPLILNGPQRCSDCSREVAKGGRAFVGLTARGLSEHYLCAPCMQARR
jgi:hypothetical protein